MRALSSMDFATVVSDKKVKKETPLRRGDVVMVMGERTVPASSTDPYLFRKLVVVASTEDGKPLVPKDDNDYNAYFVDPRNLEWVGEEKQSEYEALISTSS